MIHSKRALELSDIKNHYDRLDQVYQDLWGTSLHHGIWRNGSESQSEAVSRMTAQVLEWLEVRDGARVCDIGCGYGEVAHQIAQEYSAHVTGITVSEAQLKHAKKRMTDQGSLEFRLLDWLKNDFDSASFDHAFAIESSEHMSDLRSFAKEAYRILKPGGSFVVCAWLAHENPTSAETRWLLEPICREGRLYSLGTRSDYQRCLNEAGFVLERFEDLSSQVSNTWSISMRRMARYFLSSRERAKLLFKRWNPEADFARSVFRIRVAYALGAMKYGIFKARKPAG